VGDARASSFEKKAEGVELEAILGLEPADETVEVRGAMRRDAHFADVECAAFAERRELDVEVEEFREQIRRLGHLLKLLRPSSPTCTSRGRWRWRNQSAWRNIRNPPT